MTDLHVIADEHTTWRVYADAPAPLSEHTNATDAQRAAQAVSQKRGGARVIVHDRYHRTHQPTPALAAARTPAQPTPTRQQALIDEHTQRLPGG